MSKTAVKYVDSSVEYIDHMGSDLTVVNSARVSFGKDVKYIEEKDEKLIKYLAEHLHMTPFEHCSLTLRIKCPLYISKQIMRHRTASFNEISRRYTEENLEFYMPTSFRGQHKSSKQCSDSALPDDRNLSAKVVYQNALEHALNSYNNLLSIGVARELARGVLPNTLMTEFYMTMNLRNFAHFIKLRDESHAQLEVQDLAKDIRNILLDKFPISCKYLL